MLGGLQGHTASLPRRRLSDILLDSVLLWGTFVRMMGKLRHSARKLLVGYPTYLLYPNPKKIQEPNL